jgi:outer membrane protein TolC
MGQAMSGMSFASAAVRLISGVPNEEPLLIESVDLPAPTVQLKAVESYLALAYENRPELKMVEAGLIARQQEVFIRERMFLPDFGIAGFARWRWTTNATRQITPFAYDPYNDASAGMALVSRITFDLPVKQAQLDQSRAELSKLLVQRELLRAAIRLEVEKGSSELADALQRAQAQAEAERSARRWATAAAGAFDLGTSDTRELVDSFTAFATAGAEKLKAWHDVAVGMRSMAKVLGTAVVPEAAAAPRLPSAQVETP